MTDATALAIAIHARKIAQALASKAAPIAIAAPAITGVRRVGQQLSGVHGLYTSPPTAYSYRWLRGGVAIAGATGQTYGLQAADKGLSISFEETPSNAAGTGAVNSAAVLIAND